MSALRELRIYTFDEYLMMEENASYRSKFVDGLIFRLPGGTGNHTFVNGNIITAINLRIGGKSCRAGGSDLIVSDSSRSFSGYPDVLVVCGKPLYYGAKKNVLLNPRIIFEVSSPSTEAYDRGEKFRIYQRIPSLEDYLLVSQSSPRVEHWHRFEAGWKETIVSCPIDEVETTPAIVAFPSLDFELPLSEIYKNIDFEE